MRIQRNLQSPHRVPTKRHVHTVSARFWMQFGWITLHSVAACYVYCMSLNNLRLMRIQRNLQSPHRVPTKRHVHTVSAGFWMQFGWITLHSVAAMYIVCHWTTSDQWEFRGTCSHCKECLQKDMFILSQLLFGCSWAVTLHSRAAKHIQNMSINNLRLMRIQRNLQSLQRVPTKRHVHTVSAELWMQLGCSSTQRGC
jgi:hypothetical protein